MFRRIYVTQGFVKQALNPIDAETTQPGCELFSGTLLQPMAGCSDHKESIHAFSEEFVEADGGDRARR
jgi:hypothetical protein